MFKAASACIPKNWGGWFDQPQLAADNCYATIHWDSAGIKLGNSDRAICKVTAINASSKVDLGSGD
jgi:hypothetical protein